MATSIWLVAALPSLPSTGALRVLAISGSLAIVAFAWTFWLAQLRKQPLAWPLSPLLVGALTFLMQGRLPGLHQWLAFAVFALALRNAFVFRGSMRIASAIGALAWAVALVSARNLFA